MSILIILIIFIFIIGIGPGVRGGTDYGIGGLLVLILLLYLLFGHGYVSK